MPYQAFLGVEKSCTDRLWLAREFDERQALALAQVCNVPEVIARSLSAREISVEDAPLFLDPRLRDLLPDPSRLKDMDKAAQRFAEAIKTNEPIAVFGDYDVDGATSSALIVRFARALGVNIRLYIPDRLREGYGPNVDAVQQLAKEGIKLLVCVDCGTTAHEPLKAAKDAGLEVIVLDHHTSEPNLPPALAIVNPNRLDESLDYGYLAAVGVTYLFVIAVNRALRQAGFFTNKSEPDLLQWLDLVALGTVCDVVKLVGVNRAFVAQGLRVMSQRRNTGIAALAEAAGITKFDAYAAGFLLGPRINAAGRVGDSDIGARLLSSEDPAETRCLAESLCTLNTERRNIEAQTLAEAEGLAVTQELPMAFVISDKWHPGVIGIVASRLKDKFRRPALVIAMEGDVGKGSGRSIGNVDLGANIIAARQAGLLVNGGGHKMAAGFTVALENIEPLRRFLAERIGKQLAAEPLVPTMTFDGLIGGSAITLDFVRLLEKLGPFGTGNSEPRFALPECKILRANIVGERHVSVHFAQGGQRVKGIAFRAMESPLGQALLCHSHLHLAGHLRIDEWQGEKRAAFHISDAALPNGA